MSAPDYKIIKAGAKCGANKTDFVGVSKYAIIEQSGERFLVPMFYNILGEKLDALSFRVEELSDGGAPITSKTADFYELNAAPKSSFGDDRKVRLSDKCADVRITIISATYGNYVRTPGENGTAVSYDRTKKNRYSDEKICDLSDGKRHSSAAVYRSDAFKIAVMAVFVLILACLSFTMYLRYFTSTEESFVKNGCEYVFTGSGNAKTVELTRYRGYGRNTVIPDTIDEYKVAKIRRGAFSDVRVLRNVTIEGNPILEAGAFENFTSLRTVDLGKITSLPDAAFKDCVSLTEIRSAYVDKIGVSAFENCRSLATVSLETENPVTFKNDAFKDCVGLKSFSVKSDFTVSTSEKRILGGCTSLESISVSSLGEDTGYLKGLYGGAIPSLAELHVGHLESIPENFCSDFTNLKTITVDSLSEPTVGDRAFSGCAALATFAAPRKIVSVGEEAFRGASIDSFDGELLEYVGKGAFAANPAITSFTFNENFTAVPEEVFSDCTALKTAEIPATCARISPRAFSGCSSLESIVLPNGVRSIADSAFSKCTSLAEVELPNTLSVIGSRAFSGCSALASFTVPDTVENVGVGALSECSGLVELTVPYVGKTKDDTSGISYIFSTRLTSYTAADIPASLRKVTVTNGEIYDGIFNGANKIEQIAFGGFNSRIGARAFYGCSSLRSMRVSGEITSIGDNAFGNCTSYEKFAVPDTVAEMGKGVFVGCSALKELTLPFLGANAYTQTATLGYSFVNVYGNYSIPLTLKKVVVNDGYVGANAFNGCAGIEEVSLGDKIFTIGSGAFRNCTALKYIKLPRSLYTIGASAFENCYALTTVDLPVTLAKIEDSAFARCYTIKSIALPESLTSVGSGAFAECIHLYKVYNNSALSVNRGDAYSNGGVAQYALSVRGKGETIPSATSNGFTFMLSDDETPIAYLIGYTGSSDSSAAPDRLNIGGTFYTAYEIAPRAFWYPQGETTLVSANFGNALTAVRYRAFYGNGTIAEITVGKSLTVVENESFIGCGALKSFNFAGGATVDSIGDNAFESCVSLVSITFTDGSTVEKIGQAAFNNCTSLDSIALPEGLTEIGNSAFGNCRAIKSVSFPSTLAVIGTYAFNGCASLIKAALPQKLTEIPYGAFMDCASLETVTASDQLAVLANGAFSDCTSLKNFYYGGAGNLSIDRYAFSNCTSLQSFTVSPGTVMIDENAFSNCTSLRTLDTPSRDLKEIRSYAFSGCTSLATVNLQDSGVTEIGDNAFENCTSLGYLAAPTSLVRIGGYAFYGCSSLSSVFIDGNLEYFGSYAFGGCTSLGKITFAATDGLSVPVGAFSDCRSLRSIEIPEGIISVSMQAFGGCTSLASVKFPGTLTSIGSNAFSGCSSLAEVTIPSKVTEIGSYAFSGCSSLSSLEIQSKSAYIYDYAFYGLPSLKIAKIECQGIGNSAFKGCTALEEVRMLSGSSISGYAFSGCTSLELVYVPNTLYSVGSSAFGGCTSLFEIYNFSNLNFVIGKTNYGGIARYAYKIHTSADDRMPKAKTDKVCFVKPADKWILARYLNPETNLRLEAVTTDTGIIDDYRVVRAPFENASISSIYFGKAVTEIESGAFAQKYQLTKVEFEDGSNIDIPDSAFAYCTSLTQVVFPQYVYSIGDNAFYQADLSQTEYLPSSLAIIGDNAFAQTQLKCIYLPKNLANIGNNAFTGCTQLIEVYNFTNMRITAGSSDYGNVAKYAVIVNTDENAPRVERKYVDGCTFFKFGGSWHLYRSQSGYEIKLPEASKIGSDVKSYDVLDGAILGYSRIVVPACITKFAANAFSSSYVTIFYYGTRAEWTNLIKNVSVVVSNVFYYAKCVHEEGQWTYDRYGNIDTDVKDFVVSSETQPTCTERGKRVWRCPTCGEERTEEFGEPLGHDYDENYICKNCGQEDPNKPPEENGETDPAASGTETQSRKRYLGDETAAIATKSKSGRAEE